MVISKDQTSISVTWSTPQSPNGVITHYTVSSDLYSWSCSLNCKNLSPSSQVKYDNHTRRVEVEDVKPSVVLSQLIPATPYNITVSANTAVGEGESISIIVSTGIIHRVLLT